MRVHVLFAFLALSPAMANAGSSAALDLNDNVAHLEWTGQPNPRALAFNAGFYHRESDADFVIAGVGAKDRMTNFRDVEFSLGASLGHLEGQHDLQGSFGALSFAAVYHVPDIKGVTVSFSADGAPAVTSSGDIDGFYRASLEGAFRLVPTGEVYGGYRHVRFDIHDSANMTFDESIYAGFRFLF